MSALSGIHLGKEEGQTDKDRSGIYVHGRLSWEWNVSSLGGDMDKNAKVFSKKKKFKGEGHKLGSGDKHKAMTCI